MTTTSSRPRPSKTRADQATTFKGTKVQTSRQASRRALLAALLMATSLLLCACGGGDDEVPAGQCYVSGKPAASCEVRR